MMWWCAVLLACASYPVECPEVVTDQQRVQGVWQAVTINKDGKSLNEEEIKGIKLVIQGDTFTWDEGPRRQDTEVLLRPGTKPKALDLKCTKDDVTFEYKGIYAVEGDALKICLSMRSSDPMRPVDFTSKANQVSYVFHRVKQ